MFGRLVQKELLHHLLDFRFILVFALCALLSGLGTYVGIQNYLQQLEQYQMVSDKNRGAYSTLFDVEWNGYRWNRRPEALSPVVYGLSGDLGREVLIQYRRLLHFEASLFATDPIHALFGVLDLAFIVKFVLSLCMLLFTYDAVCGEKEAGTFRLYASFPVSRLMLALAKLAGSTLAVLIPFVFAFLLASLVLVLSPELGLEAADWERIVVLMGVFALYLTVFAAFGLWVSALTHRRMTAFLGLLGLWTVWLFVVPNLAVDAAQHLTLTRGVYDLERQSSALREEIRKERETAIGEYWRHNHVKNWNDLSKAQQTALLAGEAEIRAGWDRTFYTRLSNLQREWRNQLRREQRLGMALSAISPLSAVSFASMDLARTGPVQQERVEDALNAYLIYLAQFIQDQHALHWEDRNVRDFSPFTYQDNETMEECLVRNVFHILNLILLAILGFAGAYVAILRYDVR